VLYPVQVGIHVWEGDVLMTGATSALGVTFLDESLVSLGPNSALGIIRYMYDPVSHVGRFESLLYRGTLTTTSGRLARKSAEAMSVATPNSVIHMRGTTMAVRVGVD
jgi:hypothetical protein